MTSTTADTYWATRSSEECVDALLTRVVTYQKALTETGRSERMARAWSAYYGRGVDGGKSTNRLIKGGEQGEVVLMAPPVFATLVRQVERLLTGQKPAYKTRATNSDSSAIVEAILGDSLLDYYDRASAVPEREGEAVRSGLMLGSGYVALSWDTTTGDVTAMDPETGKEFRQGDIGVGYYTPWDVAFDPRDASEESRQWVAFRFRAKKWDLIATRPELKDELSKMNGQGPSGDMAESITRPFYEPSREDEDNVWVWEMRHKRTAALPNGRILRFASRTAVIYDSAVVAAPIEGIEGVEASSGACKSCGHPTKELPPCACCERCDHGEEIAAVEAVTADPNATTDAGYPYPELLVYEFCPEKMLGIADGHTSSFDLLGLVEAIEAIATGGMTNINMGAITNYWVSADTSPNIERLSTGANLFKGGTKPEVIDGVQISPAMMGFLEVIEGWAQMAVGLNDVAMGETSKGMPAQLAALLEAKAIQYHQQGQAAYYRLVERVRTGILKLLQRFASEPRVTELVGKANSWAQKEWSAQDLTRVTKVVVEPVNPMMKTFAGRMAMTETLGDALDPDAKMTLLLTGSLEPKMDGPKAHEGRLAREKEMLRGGVGMPPVNIEESLKKGVPVFLPSKGDKIVPLVSDRHWIDIPEYLSVLESPEARANPKVVTAVLDLVAEHQRLWKIMPPDLIAVPGGMPAPSMMPMMPPGAPPPGGPPPPGEKPGKPQDEESPPVDMPQPPPNPLSGEQPAPPMG